MTLSNRPSGEIDFLLRQPNAADGPGIKNLVASSKPLDLNSTYAYLLLATHFADTCAVIEHGGRIVAFLSTYRRPDDPSRLFVWQMAVDPAMRGQGAAKRMLRDVLARPACRGLAYIEASVNPSNPRARGVFASFAAEHQLALCEAPMFARESFAGEDHDEEWLLTIGPLPSSLSFER